MFDIFEKYLSQRITLTCGEFGLIQSFSREKKIAKREFILRRGEICGDVTFIAKGLLRLSRTDDKGNERTLRFATENGWISDRESYLTGRPSNCNIEAIENSEVLFWRKEGFRHLLGQIPVLKQFMKDLMEKSQVVNQNRIFTSISSSAEEKYLQFIENHPAIFNRLPLHMVASYLGVTRETLSRIRRYPVNK